MKLLIRILALAVLTCGALFTFIWMQPDHFQVRRSIRVHAPPSAIFPLISQPRNWREWTSWHRSDPEMQKQYKGPVQGKDAEWEWQSQTQGNGGIRFTEVYADQAVYYELHLEGLIRQANGSLTLTPEGADTLVAWEVHASTGDRFLVRALIPFSDWLIGRNFEKGLQQLKSLAEHPKPPSR